MIIDSQIEKCLTSTTLESREIPEIDLYMDQILSLLNSHFAENDSKIITKTMINNYSKAKVLAPVKGKKYTKQQIIQILIVYYLKNNMAISDIKEVLEPLYENDSDLIAIYDQFVQEKIQLADELRSILKPQLENSNDENKLLTLLKLSFMADAIKEIMMTIK
ncbi:MAG: DUF1836 domain-containing protein [Erysipelotrichaceae bacterium]|nr:DUF1836 domain-containing protein [Erysipelotrichaceae bacterium]